MEATIVIMVLFMGNKNVSLIVRVRLRIVRNIYAIVIEKTGT
jgi:hypothetical protein